MTETKATKGGREGGKPRRKRRLHRHFSIGLWMILSNIVLFFFIFYMTLSLTERALTAPRWLTQRIESGINQALPEGRISIGRLTLKVNDAGLPAAQAINLGVFDARGAEVARLNQVSLRLSAASVLSGRLRPRHLELAGAQIRVLRRADGTFDLSFGGVGGTSGTLPAILDALDSAFAQPFLDETTDVVGTDLTIALQDARSGRIWQITDGALRLDRQEGGLDISIRFDVFNGTEELAETEISIRTDSDGPGASLGASFRNAAAADIALQSPALAFLGVVNAPISGSVRSAFDDRGGLGALSAALEIGAGALQPTAATRPIRFDNAKAYLNYDPAKARIRFDQLDIRSDLLRLAASGQAYLRDFDGAWPRTLLAQFRLDSAAINSRGIWDEAVTIESGAVDMRVQLSPFAVEFGQIAARVGQDALTASATLQAEDNGWNASAQVSVPEIGADRLIALWPRNLADATRDWAARNVPSGQLKNLQLAGRADPERGLRYQLSFDFRDAAIRAVPGWPLLTGAEGYGAVSGAEMTFALEKGTMIAPSGRAVDFAGTVFRSADLTERPALAEARVRAAGPVGAMLSLLDLPPTRALSRTRFAPDFVTGQAGAEATIRWRMQPRAPADAFAYQARATVRGASSDVLLPGQTVSAPELAVELDNDGIAVAGDFTIGAVSGRGEWRAEFGPEAAGQSLLRGEVELSADTVKQFGLGLPAGAIGGQGHGEFELALAPDSPPVLTLTSALDGMTMSIPQIDWTKPAGETGALSLTAEFGEPVSVRGLNLDTAGLTVGRGELVFDRNGEFSQAILPSVRAGGWLDAPVILDSRGPGQAPAITVSGGQVDLTGALPHGGAGSAGGPISAKLNLVRVTRSISLTEVEADLTTQGGLQGRFSGRVNGDAVVSGALAPSRFGTRATLSSGNAGRVLASTGLLDSADAGALTLTLTPRNEAGDYRGEMAITGMNVRRAPVLTELLSALSIVGLLDQLSGAGIVFTSVDAEFVTAPGRVDLRRLAAVGPSLGISLDGTYDLAAARLDMQGVISPIYFLNAVGQVVSPRRGEGLFGFTFALTGPTAAPVVAVNPLSILVPGALRDIFRRQAPAGPDQGQGG